MYPPLLSWVWSWTDLPKLEPLTPEGWFVEGHGIRGGQLDRCKVWMPIHEPKNKLHLWAPQPPVADTALEELLKAHHNRTNTVHVVLIPRLMTSRWHCLFNKACDFTFVVSSGALFWPENMNDHCGLAFFVRSQFTGPGVSRELHYWWEWEGTCVKCSLKVKVTENLFCGNSSSSWGSWASCWQMWHAEWYTSRGELPTFPAMTVEDELVCWCQTKRSALTFSKGCPDIL